MTDDASPNGPTDGGDLARFLQDWAELWQQELQAQAREAGQSRLGPFPAMLGSGVPSDLAATMELCRTAIVHWADAMGVGGSGAGGRKAAMVADGLLGPGAFAAMLGSRPFPPVSTDDRDGASRTQAAAVAPDPRDAEIERLARRVDELEARLARLEPPRVGRG